MTELGPCILKNHLLKEPVFGTDWSDDRFVAHRFVVYEIDYYASYIFPKQFHALEATPDANIFCHTWDATESF